MTRPGLFAQTLDRMRPFLYDLVVFGEQAVFILAVQNASHRDQCNRSVNHPLARQSVSIRWPGRVFLDLREVGISWFWSHSWTPGSGVVREPVAWPVIATPHTPAGGY
jgi:hypothetical protein